MELEVVGKRKKDRPRGSRDQGVEKNLEDLILVETRGCRSSGKMVCPDKAKIATPACRNK